MYDSHCTLHSGIVAQLEMICTKITGMEKALQTQIALNEKNLQIQISMNEKQVEMAKIEMERRLLMLNDLRSEVTHDRNLFLRRELFDVYLKDTGVWREFVTKKLSELETRSVVWTTAIGLGLAILSLALKFLVK